MFNCLAIGISDNPELTVWSIIFNDTGDKNKNRIEAEKELRKKAPDINLSRILIVRDNEVEDDFNIEE